ncbi:MAG: TRAP transporter small permease [Thermodesulfobacteriota bacterium]
MRRFFSLFWEVILASCVVILCVAVFLQVLLRYALKVSFPPLEEVVTFSFIYTIFLGAAVGMKRMEHLNIDFLLKRAPQTLRKFLDFAIFLGTTLFLVFVVKEGILFVHDSYGQTTTYLNIPISYSYAAIPGSGLIMLYYVLKNEISIVLGKKPIAHEI